MMKFLFLLFSFFIINSSLAANLHNRLAIYDKNPTVNSCPPEDPNFRACFESLIKTTCMNEGHNKAFCSNISLVYYGMKARYFTLERACRLNNTGVIDARFCLEDWSCYLNGHHYKSDKTCGAEVKFTSNKNKDSAKS